ncbi:aldehyde dehydrogenase family protein [Noviherbaspirillum denitrificans]|uniref:Aldehyde dehydrogenase n=1 Tax=Noviherbaspirillum denitrificans TaxID=1968433 RepID=A0A254THF1_9BURK|nr:aldehyde dehydrogenase family protein [Noviherbaspirillum denitrificans]OWW22076.1 aldehyde dehydrogenase [Noviherbaspirillum denitrificans]
MTTLLSALNLIDGQWQPALAGRTASSINPADGLPIGVLADSGRDDARAAIASAKKAFDTSLWAHSARDRQSVLLQWADRLERRADLAELLMRENGKILAQARGEMAFAISEIRYYAGLARHIPGHFMEVEPGAFSATLREPAGVAGLIIPWNAPIILLVRSLGPALAAGCTVVIKPAAQTAQITAQVLQELAAIDLLPKGVVNLVSETGSEVAQELVSSEDVDVLSFTGSNLTGQRIMAAAAPTMKKLSLELGGKSCCIVFPDTDIEATAARIAAAATIISGQQCTAARRVLVHASCHEEMKRALKSAFESLVVAPGQTPGAHMGPLIDARAAETFDSNVRRAIETCDEVVVRGAHPGGALANGFFRTPTLVAHRDSGAFFCQEEIFGPFVVLEKFEDEKEAVARANHTVYGLSASVWTKDGDRGMRMARALRNGTVWINDHNRMFAEAETGGYRRSGIGRLHGYEGLGDFLETKHIFRSAGVV